MTELIIVSLVKLIVTIFSVSIVTVYIVDFTGIIEWVKRKLYYIRYSKDSVYVHYSLKPFDCSGCMSFWIFIIVSWGTLTPIGLLVFGCTTGLLTLLIRKITLI